MSIIDTFDFKGSEIIKAKNNVRMIEDFPETVLVVFSVKLFDLFLSKYDAIKIDALSAGGQKLPIYQFEYKINIMENTCYQIKHPMEAER